MAELQRLGGQTCSYYTRRRCTRTVSPEASQDARCTLLEQRRKVGAATMDRLDRLKNLADASDREVARRHVIQKNLDQITRLSCPRYVPKAGSGPLCQHQHLVSCLLLLPVCEGRCEFYLRRREKAREEGPKA
ncbi:MAG: hypothetical protein KJ720_06960 [Proteobacteria bacterium]|nr:hypothetical protein [Pseudomonadota bacterium]MBU1453043.1 hypothetical protein [Pseudomonadota bacterium]MBU2470661.1 hypothetical protein [Pseudomonadota bacterium]MBU2518904.1 hypothetical protein [Pseudomonadota bacterium]